MFSKIHTPREEIHPQKLKMIMDKMNEGVSPPRDGDCPVLAMFVFFENCFFNKTGPRPHKT